MALCLVIDTHCHLSCNLGCNLAQQRSATLVLCSVVDKLFSPANRKRRHFRLAGALVALGALKDEISELRYGQQKIIAELRSAQQELQLSSVKTTYWYSELNALLHQQVASKPTAAAVRNNKPSAQPRPLQEVNAEPRNGTVPLPLARSQTTAPDAVPIR